MKWGALKLEKFLVLDSSGVMGEVWSGQRLQDFEHMLLMRQAIRSEEVTMLRLGAVDMFLDEKAYDYAPVNIPASLLAQRMGLVAQECHGTVVLAGRAGPLTTGLTDDQLAWLWATWKEVMDEFRAVVADFLSRLHVLGLDDTLFGEQGLSSRPRLR